MRPTLALCMIVKPSDDEAVLLDRVLAQSAQFFDEVCITITGQNIACEKVCGAYKGIKVSHIEWEKDFAKARNFNFSQATSDYIMWVDSDDLIKGVEHIDVLMKKIGDNGNVIDGVVMDYLYDFDEYNVCVVRHKKMRIIKNDRCMEWVGAVHEDFKENRKLLAEFCPDIEIIHAQKQESIPAKMARNTEIAKNEVALKPDDPRSYWLVANALLSEGKGERALEYFYKFIEMSHSEEEIFLAYNRMSVIFLETGDTEKAFMCGLQALRLRPWYPDPYYTLAKIYVSQHNYRAAEIMLLDGLQNPVPENEAIVWNPRDYDVNPLNLLANVYFEMEKPREAKLCLEKILKVYPHRKDIKKVIELMDERIVLITEVEKQIEAIKKAKDKAGIKKILDNIPDELKAYPAICAIRNEHFTKDKSGGKDIAFYCGYTSEVWTPDTLLTKGIGGSEEAIVNLSRELHKKGWNVEVYNNCGYKDLDFGGVKFKPYWSWNPRDKQDVVVLWRSAKILDFEINADKVLLDLHDVIPPGELNSLRVKKLYKIMVKSRAQRDLFPGVPDDKFAIIPNGVDVSLFDKYIGKVKRNPYHLINTSSPDRSLETILDMIPEIVKRLPEKIAKKFKVFWYYGWNVFDASYSQDSEAQSWKKGLMDKFEALRKKGLIDGGFRMGQDELAKRHCEVGALFYPSEFFEIDYITGTKAQLAGNIPITTDFAALDDKIRFGHKVHSLKTMDNWTNGIHWNYGVTDPKTREELINAVVDYLTKVDEWDIERGKMSAWARVTYNWGSIASRWDEVLNNKKV